jgi:Tfp pilus assembly protein PilP
VTRLGPRVLAWLPLVLLLAGSAAARAADPPKPPGGAAPGAPSMQGPGTTSTNPASAEPTDTINRIIQDNEAILSGRGFTYDPAGRRDPFRSLVDALNSAQKGPRPRGIAGMLISEINLVGIVQKGRQAIAFFNGTDNKGYFLRVGDALYDGKITRIDRKTGMVMFRQDVNDPRSIKPYRDVTKRLTPTEEGSL